jgi:hypothetical protein
MYAEFPNLPDIPLSQPRRRTASKPSAKQPIAPDRHNIGSAVAGDMPITRPIGLEEGSRDDNLYRWACSCFARGWSHDQVLAECRFCNSTFRPPLDDAIVEQKVDSAAKYEQPATATVLVPGAASVAPAQIDTPMFSDDHLALEFVSRHGHEIRYLADWGWLRFNGRYWEHDKTLAVYDLVRNSNRDIAATVDDKRMAKGIVSAKTRAAVEQMARADRRVVAIMEQFDTEPWLLNTPDVTINLKTQQIYKHRPQDYITKMLAVTPGGDCPRWRQFIKEITGHTGGVHPEIDKNAEELVLLCHKFHL